MRDLIKDECFRTFNPEHPTWRYFGGGGGGKGPKPPPTPDPIPKKVEVDVAAAEKEERDLAAKRRGRSRSILTRELDFGRAETSKAELLGL